MLHCFSKLLNTVRQLLGSVVRKTQPETVMECRLTWNSKQGTRTNGDIKLELLDCLVQPFEVHAVRQSQPNKVAASRERGFASEWGQMLLYRVP